VDKVFIVFLFAVLGFGGAILVGELYSQPSASTTTSSTLATTTSSTTTTTTTYVATTVTLPVQTTTTTLKPIPEFFVLNWSNLDRCRNTHLGGMNSFLAYVDSVEGTWADNPADSFEVGCRETFISPVSVLRRGGTSVILGSQLEGIYSIRTRCGRNQIFNDLSDCRNMTVRLKSSKLNITSVGGEAVEVLETEDSKYETSDSEPPTSTTLAHNPYLDRFRDLGYRRVDLDISWLCPSCVPAVNKLVMSEPGVKSRSLAYRQEVNYVIYDPNVVKLERVLELSGAGGDVRLISDEEF
jgi:hypothetical protein